MPHFTTSDGLQIFYDDAGSGLPLLCLPGLTRTTEDFRYVIPHLPPCRLIRIDYRGRGRSEWDKDWRNYTLPVEMRDVLELLDHLSVDRTAILGTSRGGLISMGLAATAPDRISGAALNDVGPEIDPNGITAIMTYLGRRPAAKTHEEAAHALSHALEGFHNVPMERWRQEAHLHFNSVPDGLDITYDPALRQAVEATGEVPDLWPLFDALTGKPLCLIRGAGSNLLSADTARKMRDRRPDMIFAEVPDRGHVPFLDEPEAVSALRTWMEALT